MAQERKLKRAEAEDIPQDRLDTMARPGRNGLQESVECTAAAQDPVRQLRCQPTVGAAKLRLYQVVIQHFLDVRVLLCARQQHLQGHAARIVAALRGAGNEASHAGGGPKRSPAWIGLPRRNSSVVMRRLPASWSSRIQTTLR